jgi:hypothetical protein
MAMLRVVFLVFLACSGEMDVVAMATSAAGDIPLEKPSALVSVQEATHDEPTQVSVDRNISISLNDLKELLAGSDEPPALPAAPKLKWMMPAANVVLLVAAVFLVLAFLALKFSTMGNEDTKLVGVLKKSGAKAVNAVRKRLGQEEKKDSNVMLVFINVLFLVSGALWLHGFLMVVFALETLPTPLPMHAMLPLYMKVIASAFFVIGPLTALLSFNTLDLGLKWANLIGIILFHFGNMMTLGFGITGYEADKDPKKTFAAHSNGLTLQHIFYTLGTTMLLAATYHQAKSEHIVLSGDPIDTPATGFLQIAGSMMLLVGCSMAVYADIQAKKESATKE